MYFLLMNRRPQSLTLFPYTTLFRSLPEWHFDFAAGRKILLKQLGAASLAGYGCEDLEPAIAACGALLEYARRSEVHTSELPSRPHFEFRILLRTKHQSTGSRSSWLC